MLPLEWQIFEAGYCLHPELAVRRGGKLSCCEFPALTCLIQHPQHGRILFDTGYANAFLHATRTLPERLYRMVTPVRLEPHGPLRMQLAAQGVQAGDIGLIVISHLHADHVSGIADFPDVPLQCSREAWHDMQRRGRIDALRHGLLPELTATAHGRLSWFEDAAAVPLPPPFAEFGQGRDLLGDGSLLAVPLPGHAAGHHGLLFRDTQARTIFLVADAAWSSQSIRDGVPPPRLVTRLLGDTSQYRQTLQRLQHLSQQAPDVLIVPSHCREWRPHG